ncbi:unnamed protein product, partial [Polarella glacialis]
APFRTARLDLKTEEGCPAAWPASLISRGPPSRAAREANFGSPWDSLERSFSVKNRFR